MLFLEREIILDVTQEKLWEFLATPAHLNELTPPQLNFQILSELPEQMYNGLTILYSIRIPLFGRRRWLTEIKHIRAGEYFVDEQRLGPYRFWYHQNLLEPVGKNRTRMIDRGQLPAPVRSAWFAGAQIVGEEDAGRDLCLPGRAACGVVFLTSLHPLRTAYYGFSRRLCDTA